MTAAVRKLPPGPRPLPIVGNIISFGRSPNHYLLENALNYGEISSFYLAGVRAHIIANPDYVQEILIKRKSHFTKSKRSREILGRFLGQGLLVSVDDYHARQRQMVQPAFHATRIHQYADSMVTIARQARETWGDGEIRDIHHEMMRITMEVVAKTLFGGDVVEDALAVGEAMAYLQEVANKRFTNPFSLPRWIPTETNRRAVEAGTTIYSVVMRFIQERRAEGTPDKGDLLSMLLLSEDDQGVRMTDEEVRNEALTLFSAGHETTSNALAWTWYLLAQNPQAEAKLHEEVDRVLAGRAPTLADLRALPYTHMIVKEAMRLFPPAWTLMLRDIKQDVQFGNYTLPAGDVVFISPYVLHHLPDYWEDPQEFRPERFAPEQEKNHHKYQYLPFGGGEHICIGSSYAMMEAALVLAEIASHTRLSLATTQPVADRALVTLMPRNGLAMRVTHRSGGQSQ